MVFTLKYSHFNRQNSAATEVADCTSGLGFTVTTITTFVPNLLSGLFEELVLPIDS